MMESTAEKNGDHNWEVALIPRCWNLS